MDTIEEDTIWSYSLEPSFGEAVALGYDRLTTAPDTMSCYHALIRKAGQTGPTLGKLMAVFLPPVLVCKNNRLLKLFEHTVEIMLKKGTYTLAAPLEFLSIMLDGGDIKSALVYLRLLSEIFSQDFSYNQSLRLCYMLPKALGQFPPEKRTWQIRQLRRVVREDIRLAELFSDGMKNGLCLLSQKELSRFITMGLTKFRLNPDSGKKFLSLESKLGKDTCAEMQSTVFLSQIQQALNRYLRARIGIQIAVRSLALIKHEVTAPPPMVVSDGKFIYLPDEISIFSQKYENMEIYKCLTKLESAYYEFHTFDFDLEKALERAGILSEPFEIDSQNLSDMERFFGFFPIKKLACDLFTIFEHGRIRVLLYRNYPGIIRQILPLLQREAVRLCQNTPLFHLYARIALDMRPPQTDIGKFIEDYAALFERKIGEDDSVETCAELVFETYHHAFVNLISEPSNSPNPPPPFPEREGGDVITAPLSFQGRGRGRGALIYIPLNIPFGRILRPDIPYQTFREFERIAETLKNRLKEKGIHVYKSDIKKLMIRNSGRLSADELKELIFRNAKDTENASEPDLSWLVLSDIQSEIAMDDLPVSGTVFWYREWDSNLNDYLHQHVRVSDRFVDGIESDFYPSALQRHQGLVRKIRYAFELLKPQGLVILRNWTEGDEFDYRALLDFVMDKKAKLMPSDRLYIKRIKQDRDVAVLLLVDMSRSTANAVPGNDASVMDIEKQALVLFCEALDVVGDAFCIAGFSGTGRLGLDYFRIKNFDEAMDNTVRNRISAMSPQRSTRMGGAIRHAVTQLRHHPAKVRLLLVLGDGFPNDADYKEQYAIDDTHKAICEARSENIHVKAITVNLDESPMLDELYGSVHHHVISDVRELPDKLLRIYRALTR